MDTIAHTPDTPFRSGVTGKYKLLIKDVTPKVNDYEYALVDADGEYYKAVSPKHFAPGQLLRCMVHFKVANASFVVTETLICSKQDFATPIPEPPKPQPKPKADPKTKVKASTTKLGNPSISKVTGTYKLRIVDVNKGKKLYSYVLEDAVGHQYVFQSIKQCKVGTVVNCLMNVKRKQGDIKATIVSMGGSRKSHCSNKRYSGGNSRSWLPSPPAGGYFHLIYTPMGNKR